MVAVLVAGLAWSVLAIWFDGPVSRISAGSLASMVALISLALAASVRPLLRGLTIAMVPIICVLLWWNTIPVPPQNLILGSELAKGRGEGGLGKHAAG
jgi:hypothetical protein